MKPTRTLALCTAIASLLSPAAYAATYTLAPLAYQTVLDVNGNPVSGAKICTYLAGTTTPTATFSDSTGTQNLNPIVADGSGRFVAYLLPGASYKFVFQDATGTANVCNGVQIRTQDNITAVPPASGNIDVTGTAGEALTAGQVVYLSDGSAGKTAGQWFKADNANTYGSTLPEIGFAVASVTSGSSGTIRVGGSVTGLSSLTIGAKYYIGTAGAMTSTAPANRRELGQADTTTSLVLAGNPALQSALASGTPSNGRFLRGDQTWATLATVITTTATGAQNDFAPGLIGAYTVIRCNNASLLTISGFGGGTYNDGDWVRFVSIGAGQVDFVHQSASSSAGNRMINFATSGNTSLAPGVGVADFTYDATTARWRLVSHEQGQPITATFAGGNFTANGAMTWTVDAGDVGTMTYYLKGRLLLIQFVLSTTTVAGTPNTTLQIGNGAFGGFTLAKTTGNSFAYIDSGVAQTAGTLGVTSTLVQLLKAAVANWTAAVNTTTVSGQLNVEVQ